MSPVRFRFVVTMAIPRSTAFTSQIKMRRVSLLVGLILLVCLAADAVESSSFISASARKASHSSGNGSHRQHRFLRSRQVQSSQPAPINNESPQPLGSPDTMGILPVEAPENQNAPAQGEASVEENATLTPPGESAAEGAQGEMGEAALAAASPGLPASVEREEGNGGENNNEVGANGSESAPGLDIDPSVLQSGILGILPVTIPENQNVSGQVEAPVTENAAYATSGESGTQEESVQPVRDAYSPPPPVTSSTPVEMQKGANGGAPSPGASESQSIAPPAANEGHDVSPPSSESEGNQIAPPPPERHSTIPKGKPEGNGGRGNALPTGNGSQGGDTYHQQGKEGTPVDGRIDSNEDIAGTIPVTDEKVLEEIKEEERKVRTIGGFGIFLAIFAMIFTAWQMSDNPDGIYAAMCRLIITIIGLVMRILLSPCRSCFGGSHGSRNYAGHMPVSTMEYGFRDPALELS